MNEDVQSAVAQRFEAYLVQLIQQLDRMATVMERFENALNPTWTSAEEDLRDIVPIRLAGEEFPAVEFPHGSDTSPAAR